MRLGIATIAQEYWVPACAGTTAESQCSLSTVARIERQRNPGTIVQLVPAFRSRSIRATALTTNSYSLAGFRSGTAPQLESIWNPNRP